MYTFRSRSASSTTLSSHPASATETAQAGGRKSDYFLDAMGFIIESNEFVLPPKYVPLQQKLLGKGAYGQVIPRYPLRACVHVCVRARVCLLGAHMLKAVSAYDICGFQFYPRRDIVSNALCLPPPPPPPDSSVLALSLPPLSSPALGLTRTRARNIDRFVPSPTLKTENVWPSRR